MPSSLSQRLSECLSELRARQGWTLDQLAAESGVSRAALSRLENAEVSPSADVLDRLARAYGMTVSRLLALTEDSFPAHVDKDDQPIWKDEATGYTRRTVSPQAQSLGAELLECKLPPNNSVEHVSPLRAGQEHHIWMVSGYMRVTHEDRAYDLGPGDALRLMLANPATLTTAKGQGARFLICALT